MEMAKTRKSASTDYIRGFVESGVEAVEVYSFTAIALKRALDRLFPTPEGKAWSPRKIHVVERGGSVFLINREVVEERQDRELARS